MGVSVIGIGVLVVGVLLVGAVVVSIIVRLFKKGGDGSTTPVARGVTLSCPHCGGQTEAARPQCQHCSKEL
ncbi:MAG: hypothetical protein ACI8P0_001756 [Planctomycetaceae bacterium]|jgi:hypothetical protein